MWKKWNSAFRLGEALVTDSTPGAWLTALLTTRELVRVLELDRERLRQRVRRRVLEQLRVAGEVVA